MKGAGFYTKGCDPFRNRTAPNALRAALRHFRQSDLYFIHSINYRKFKRHRVAFTPRCYDMLHYLLRYSHAKRNTPGPDGAQCAAQ